MVFLSRRSFDFDKSQRLELLEKMIDLATAEPRLPGDRCDRGITGLIVDVGVIAQPKIHQDAGSPNRLGDKINAGLAHPKEEFIVRAPGLLLIHGPPPTPIPSKNLCTAPFAKMPEKKNNQRLLLITYVENQQTDGRILK
jgi:hypothetical protein